MQEISLSDVIEGVGELYGPLTEEKNLRFFVDIPPEGAVIRGNRNLVSQALANLVDNAIKYAPGGGLVAVELENRGAESALIVADHGPGIPSADRDRVTQRFVRLESSRNSPGTGLGLSLVAAVARLHDATLSFEDNHPGLRAALVFHRIGDEPRRVPAAQPEIRAQPEPVH
jgi:signal transduction histidine kinase